MYRVLRRPLLHTHDSEWARKSKISWSVCERQATGWGTERVVCWRSSLLGILNGLFGVVLVVPQRAYEVREQREAREL